MQILKPDGNSLLKNVRAMLKRGIAPESVTQLDLNRTAPFLMVENGGKTYFGHLEGNNFHPIDNVDDPIEAARAWRDQLDIEIPGGHFVIIGLGSGNYLQALLEKADEETLIWVVEPDLRIASLSLGILDLTAAIKMPKIYWSFGEAPDRLLQRMNKSESYSRLGAQGIKILVTPVARRYYGELIQQYGHIIQQHIEDERLLARTNAIQQVASLGNLKRTAPLLPKIRGLKDLWSVWAGIPTVVAAAGPSLQDHLPQLKRIRDRIGLIAVDTAHRTLRKAGLQPDMVVSLDFTELNARHLEDGPIGDEILLAYVCVHPSIFERFPPENTIAMSVCSLENRNTVGRPITKILGLDLAAGQLPTGGSTTHSAISVARMMGAAPILLLGADLAFPGERFYSDGALQLELDVVERMKNEHIFVPSNDGGTVATNIMFQRYINETARIIELQGIDAINLSKHGARLGEIPYRPWEEIEHLFPPGPIHALERLHERIAKVPPLISVKDLDTACASLMRKLEDQASAFSQLRRKVDALNPNDALPFKRALKDLVAVVYLGSSKDDFLGMLSKYVGPTWIEFVGHGDGVGLVGGNTPDSNRVAQERYSNLLRDLGRAIKAHREALFHIRTELKHRNA